MLPKPAEIDRAADVRSARASHNLHLFRLGCGHDGAVGLDWIGNKPVRMHHGRPGWVENGRWPHPSGGVPNDREGCLST